MIVIRPSERYRQASVWIGGSLGEKMKQLQPPPPAALLSLPNESHHVQIKDPEARKILGEYLDFEDAEDLQRFVDHVLGQFRLLRTWSEEPALPNPSDQFVTPPGA
jgi:hypothetical protein